MRSDLRGKKYKSNKRSYKNKSILMPIWPQSVLILLSRYLQNDVGFSSLNSTHSYIGLVSIFDSTKRNSCNKVPIILYENINFNVWSLPPATRWRTVFFFYLGIILYILKPKAIQWQRHLPSVDMWNNFKCFFVLEFINNIWVD